MQIIVVALLTGAFAGTLGHIFANFGSNHAIKQMGDRTYPDYPIIPQWKERAFRLSILLGMISMYVLDVFIGEQWYIALFHSIILTALFISDARDHVIPNIIVIPAFFVELLIQYLTKNPLLVANLIVTAIVVTAIGVFYIIGKRKGRTIGGGDVRVMLFLALWQGIFVVLTIPLACTLALIYLVAGKRKESPFGPFLVIASLIVMSFAIQFTLWLFNLFF